MSPAIEQLLQQPEGKTLEFKRDLSSPRNVLKTLVAFANSAGGRMVIGVDDDSQIAGVVEPLDEEERICNLIADSIAPRLVPNVELASIGERTVLVVEVFPSSSRPHYLSQEGPDNGVYVRLGSSNRQAGPEPARTQSRARLEAQSRAQSNRMLQPAGGLTAPVRPVSGWSPTDHRQQAEHHTRIVEAVNRM